MTSVPVAPERSSSAAMGNYPHVEEVRSLITAVERDLNDSGPWGNGYRQALAEVRKQIDLRFGPTSESNE